MTLQYIYLNIQTRLPRTAISGVLLLLIFGIALSLRIFLPYEDVFGGDWVRLGEVDPWYHVRLVENLLQHFPHIITFDPFTLYPYGQDVVFAPFFDLLIGFLAWVIGVGNPSPQVIETIAAYLPAIFGALVTIPVYFIGRELFNRNVGLLSAALIAVLPGQFLLRSTLGFADHHIAEVLFSTVTVLFLILAIKSARGKELSFGHMRAKALKNVRKPLIYTLLAGVFLGMYLLTWAGGLLFVFIILAYILVQYVVDHLKGKSTDYLCIIGVPSFLIALLLIIPFPYPPYPGKGLVIAALAIGVLAFLGLSVVSRLMAYRNMKRAYYPLVLAFLGSAGVGIFYLVDPALFNAMLGSFNLFATSTLRATIGEAAPISPVHMALFFTTASLIVPISLVIIAYTTVKDARPDRILLLVWCLVVLVAMAMQSRFAYYFAVNAALLTGYLSWKLVERGLRGESNRERYILGSLAMFLIFLVVFLPNIFLAVPIVVQSTGPNDDWHDSLVWMRDNTPEPFGDPDFYYEFYDRPASGEWDYPESAYGVMSWWDYGHWITRIARRIPNSNPHQYGAEEAALFFIAQDEPSANEVLDALGSKYVIIDVETAMVFRKFHTIPIWAGQDRDEFFEQYYQRTEEGKLEQITLYYPEYYQSMCSRLYNFGGEAVVPGNSTWVISYVEEGGKKEISTEQLFSTYEEAQAYLESQACPDCIIVGKDPFASPVPLDKLEHYDMIHQTDLTEVRWMDQWLPDRQVHYVRIFEYLP